MILQVENIIIYCFQKKKSLFELKDKMRKKGRGGVSDSWMDVRKRGGGGGGVIQMRTVCNKGVGGSKNQEKMRM